MVFGTKRLFLIDVKTVLVCFEIHTYTMLYIAILYEISGKKEGWNHLQL